MPRILVVDDHATSREGVAKLLRQEGFDVVRAASGADALALLDCYGADLALVDLLMPDMDGLAFAEVLRRDDRFKDVPVVMLSAVTDGGTIHRAQKAGVRDYLIKSRVTPNEIVAKVREQLELAHPLPHEQIADRPAHP
ncbi:MAG: response regulator [Tepidisphaeraceae bacterium]